jgi:hypothetical protein
MSRSSYQNKQCKYRLSHNYYAIHYYTIPLLHLALPYNYYTPTLLDCTQPYLNCTSRHFTITLPAHHHIVLDLTNVIITSHNFTYTLHHAAQPRIYFTLSLYQINVYLFSTVRYNTLPLLNFAPTKPNFTELNTNLAKHSNTNLAIHYQCFSAQS